MAPSTVENIPDEEDYKSDEDEDFNPDAAPADGDEVSSSSEDEAEDSSKRTKKRKEVAEDLDFNNSGDEATISKSKRKKKRRKGIDADQEDEGSGGEGGLIKTRAQRAVEVKEKKPLVQAGKSSVDVDALWAQMTAGATKSQTPQPKPPSDSTPVTTNGSQQPQPQQPPGPSPDPATQTVPPPQAPTHLPKDTITINRTFTFAGETHTESRTVPATSAEAKLYLAEQAEAAARAAGNAPTGAPSSKPLAPGLRRPKKRVSMFSSGAAGNDATKPAKEQKLNTLQKSRLDWAAHVDSEGISEELDEARRAKGGYLGKMDFLGRMDAKREGEGI